MEVYIVSVTFYSNSEEREVICVADSIEVGKKLVEENYDKYDEYHFFSSIEEAKETVRTNLEGIIFIWNEINELYFCHYLDDGEINECEDGDIRFDKVEMNTIITDW